MPCGGINEVHGMRPRESKGDFSPISSQMCVPGYVI